MFHSPTYIWLQVLQGLVGTADEHGSYETARTMKMENQSQTTLICCLERRCSQS